MWTRGEGRALCGARLCHIADNRLFSDLLRTGLPAPIPLSVQTSRSALSAAAIKKAQDAAASAVDMDAVKKQLAEFSKLRAAALKEVADALGGLQSKTAKAWVFTAEGDLATTVLDLVKGIPLQSAVYTAGVMLVGENLQGIKGMIHELDTDTGA